MLCSEHIAEILINNSVSIEWVKNQQIMSMSQMRAEMKQQRGGGWNVEILRRLCLK